MKTITYQINHPVTAARVATLYRDAGLNRPVDDEPRLAALLAHSNLIISAWDGHELVGLARAMTDFAWSCYLADLAVQKRYQHHGIGKRLVQLVREAATEQSTVVLIAAPGAAPFYENLGMEKREHCFTYPRKP